MISRSRRGITLLEVLVSAILLGIGLLGCLTVVAHTTAVTAGAVDRTRALIAARSKLEEILKEPVLQVGSERGEGVDETTDYDWAADITESPDPSLYVIAVEARNRITGVSAIVTALRRPDLNPPQTVDPETGQVTSL